MSIRKQTKRLKAVMSHWCVNGKELLLSKRKVMKILLLKILCSTKIALVAVLSNTPWLTESHLHESPCSVCKCTSVWHHRSDLDGGGRWRCPQCHQNITFQSRHSVVSFSRYYLTVSWIFTYLWARSIRLHLIKFHLSSLSPSPRNTLITCRLCKCRY